MRKGYGPGRLRLTRKQTVLMPSHSTERPAPKQLFRKLWMCLFQVSGFLSMKELVFKRIMDG